MNFSPEMLAELQAEYDWILWKMEEDKKSWNSEYKYSSESGEYKEDLKRLKEIKLLLNL